MVWQCLPCLSERHPPHDRASRVNPYRRKIEGRPELEAAFEAPLARAAQIRSQQQRQRGWKLYSFHAPEVEYVTAPL